MASRQWTLGGRLAVNAAVSVACTAATAVVGIASITATNATNDHVDRLATARSSHQEIDMSHDAIHAIVVTSALAGEHGDLNTVEQQRNLLRDQIEAVDGRFAEVIDASRGHEDLQTEIQRAAAAMGSYTTLATRIVDAPGGVAFSERDWSRFETATDELEALLGSITDDFRLLIDEARAHADETQRLALLVVLLTAGVAIVAVVVGGRLLRRSITTSVDDIATVAGAVAQGDLTRRVRTTATDEFGRLGRSFDDVAGSLNELVDRLRVDAERSTFGRDLGSVLELIDDEASLMEFAGRAMTHTAPAAMEVLLADSSRAHLERVVVHPEHGAAGCGVGSPFDCAAVRRGALATFPSSDALGACPRLSGRCAETVAAVCAPVSFMGRSVGVLHTVRSVDRPFVEDEIERIGTFAAALGGRIGTIRAFQKSQLRASTDGLTGLMNRRSLEEQLGTMVGEQRTFSLAVADLDHFKQLNDTYGHEMGDRALRLFAEVLRATLRSDDLVARWGGEEFTLAFPDIGADEAASACDRIREALFVATSSGSVPGFTVSFGVVDGTAGTDLKYLLGLADEALYAAKNGGRNRVVVGPVLGTSSVPPPGAGPLPGLTSAVVVPVVVPG